MTTPRRQKTSLLLVLTVVAAVVGCSEGKAKERQLRLRLQWYPQAQFAGYLVANEMGLYAQKGLNVEILPAGPDLKPHVTVASGTDDIGIGLPNQIITARSNGVPLVIIAQIFQDSPTRFVAKRDSAINTLRDVRNRKVGLWLGGDEAEFIAMLEKVGMSLNDVKVVPQGFSIAPFLEEDYALSQVTTYNELIQLRQELGEEVLTVFSPSDFDAEIIGDLVFTTEELTRERPQDLADFLAASLAGWRFCQEDEDLCLKAVLAANPELDREVQKLQLEQVLELIFSGSSGHEIGFMDRADYVRAQEVLLTSGQLDSAVDIDDILEESIWQMAVSDSKAALAGGEQR